LPEKNIPIGKIGITIERIRANDYGLAYFPEIGEARIKALEDLAKYTRIICVKEPNKCREYRIIEAKPKTWNVYRRFSMSPGQKISPAVKVDGEAVLLSIGIHVTGSATEARNLTIEVKHDEEKTPSLTFSLYNLKYLGGGLVPTPNSYGGLTIEDNTNYEYGGFLNPNFSFKYKCELSIENKDTANAVTVDLYLLFGLKETITEVFIRGGTAGEQGGMVTDPTESSSGSVGGGAEAAARLV